jgi:hypothetical protein
MNNSLRLICLAAVAACLALAARTSRADATPAQPTATAPGATVSSPVAAPAGAVTPSPRPITPQLPRSLEGVITQDEYAAFVRFQQGLREDPVIKDLSTQIHAKMSEMLALQKQIQAAQQKAIDANPDIKAIADKMKKGRPKPPAAPMSAAPAPARAPAPATAAAPAAAVPTPASK